MYIVCYHLSDKRGCKYIYKYIPQMAYNEKSKPKEKVHDREKKIDSLHNYKIKF